MRRVMPLWASLFAVLLLAQWAGGVAACLPRWQGPAMVLCHAGDDPGGPVPAEHGGMVCPLCAPLPPVVLGGPGVVVPVPRAGFVVAGPVLAPGSAALSAVMLPQQARAPPGLS